MINTYELELPLSRTYFHSPRLFEPLKICCNLQAALKDVGNNTGKSGISVVFELSELSHVKQKGVFNTYENYKQSLSFKSISSSKMAVTSLKNISINLTHVLYITRITVVVLCGISILWLPMVKSSQGGQLFIYLNSVQAYFGAPVGIVYIWAIWWKRCSEKVSV